MRVFIVGLLLGIGLGVIWAFVIWDSEMLYFEAPPTSPLQPHATTTTMNQLHPVDNGTVYRSQWKKGVATVFWVGEVASDENGFIANHASAWDEEWETHFGGLDNPECRTGFNPCGLLPRENPFYVALPYSDLTDDGERKPNAARIPWNNSRAESESSVVKNRWVEIRVKGKSCFAQWEDVGPFETDDIEYVFGTAMRPKNTEGEKAGIDVSPAVRDCLSLSGSEEVDWRHVDRAGVPAGPWTVIVTEH